MPVNMPVGYGSGRRFARPNFPPFTTKIMLFGMERSRSSHLAAPYFNKLQEEFVTYRNNGILPSINEFAQHYQSKNNRIYPPCENGGIDFILGDRGDRKG
jgi:hypothetical protein